VRPGRIVAALAYVAVIVLAAIAGLRVGGGSSASAPDSGTTRSDSGTAAKSSPEPTPAEQRLRAALEEGVTRAAALGGDVEAAAMLDGSAAPIVATSERGGAERYMRMWSMSKVATMVALLRLLGWGERPGETLSAEIVSALEGALTRSENCRQRRIVLELQRAARGIAGAQRALAEVFSLSGGRIVPGSQVEAPEPLCVPFLSEQTEIPEPLAPALLLGTSRWRVADAVRLAHALAVGTYGTAISARVLELMRAPKRPSRESEPGELTAPLDWGAGAVFPDLIPADKAGWGGSLNGNFLAGQIAVVPFSNDHLALAVMFHPDAQPSRDDPGITAAPEAVETVMGLVRSSILPSGNPKGNR
jgi:hypothetical protein